MAIVVKARRTEEGIIIHELDNGEKKQYMAVRGGLSWPLMTDKVLPAYYCIVGEELINAAQRRENQRGRLILLSEYEAPDILSLAAFFTKLTDDAKLLACNTFYTVIKESQGEDYSGHAETLRKFAYDKQIAVHLEEAPWAEKPDLGLFHINEWMKRGLLELPEGSLIRNQLKTVVAEKVNQLPQMLNAVNALRFIVCGFEKYKPSNTSSNWRSKTNRGTWKSA